VTTARQRVRDLWQLHIPLVIVLAFCSLATVIEYRRATEGVDRAWVYTFQWPIIGIVALVIWNRYRHHGSLTRSIGNYFHERAARFTAEAEAREAEQAERELRDPDALAWRTYVEDLHRHDPPGRPPG
jgi:hypothetical protein